MNQQMSRDTCASGGARHPCQDTTLLVVVRVTAPTPCNMLAGCWPVADCGHVRNTNVQQPLQYISSPELTESEAGHGAEAVREAQELVVAACQLEEGKHSAAKQDEDVEQKHCKVEELPGRDEEDLRAWTDR